MLENRVRQLLRSFSRDARLYRSAFARHCDQAQLNQIMEGSKDQDFNTFYTEVSINARYVSRYSFYLAPRLSPSVTDSERSDANFQLYLRHCQVKAIEKRDAVLTSEQQINRLLRPGSSYFNLNPFEVLRVEPESTLDEMKTKFKRVTSSDTSY
jgi:hypothetical protein